MSKTKKLYPSLSNSKKSRRFGKIRDALASFFDKRNQQKNAFIEKAAQKIQSGDLKIKKGENLGNMYNTLVKQAQRLEVDDPHKYAMEILQ